MSYVTFVFWTMTSKYGLATCQGLHCHMWLVAAGIAQSMSLGKDKGLD